MYRTMKTLALVSTLLYIGLSASIQDEVVSWVFTSEVSLLQTQLHVNQAENKKEKMETRMGYTGAQKALELQAPHVPTTGEPCLGWEIAPCAEGNICHQPGDVRHNHGRCPSTDCICNWASPCPDGTPAGVTESRVRYFASTVTSPDVCQSQTQTRMCHDGQYGSWVGGIFSEPTCIVQAAAQACWDNDTGTGTASGDESLRVRYARSLVIAPAECEQENQIRTCNAGNFSSWSGTYSELTCEVDEVDASQ